MATVSALPGVRKSYRNPVSPVTGSARWVRRPDGVTCSGGLEITTRTGTDLYHVEPILGTGVEVVGYRLTKLGESNDVYDVDLSFGGDLRHWECDCPDFVFRRQGTGMPCKHCCGLHAALNS